MDKDDFLLYILKFIKDNNVRTAMFFIKLHPEVLYHSVDGVSLHRFVFNEAIKKIKANNINVLYKDLFLLECIYKTDSKLFDDSIIINKLMELENSSLYGKRKLYYDKLVNMVKGNYRIVKDERLITEKIDDKVNLNSNKSLNVAKRKKAITIDNSLRAIKDDALSCERISDSVYLLGIHITDLSELLEVMDDSKLKKLLAQGKTLYKRSGVEQLLSNYITKSYSLNKGFVKPCVSIYVEINTYNNMINCTLEFDEIEIVDNITYDFSDDVLVKNKEYKYSSLLKDIYKSSEELSVITEMFPFGFVRAKDTLSKKMVSEFSMLYNSLFAFFLDKSNMKAVYKKNTGELYEGIRFLKDFFKDIDKRSNKTKEQIESDMYNRELQLGLLKAVAKDTHNSKYSSKPDSLKMADATNPMRSVGSLFNQGLAKTEFITNSQKVSRRLKKWVPKVVDSMSYSDLNQDLFDTEPINFRH